MGELKQKLKTGLRVLIIGDVMIDRYLTGRVNRISPEAPVPVLDYRETEDRLGGAANVALNLLKLECQVYLLSLVGQDEEGRLLKKLVSEAGIQEDYIISTPTRRTTLKTRVMAGNHHLLRVDREDRFPLSTDEEELVLAAIHQCIEQSKPEGIILQDYNKGLLTSNVIQSSIKKAKEWGIPVFVDPKVSNIRSYEDCTIFKPNLKEAESIIGENIELTHSGLNVACEKLQEMISHQLTLITLSNRGLFIKEKDREGIHIEAIPQKVADVCGAGDTVISMMAVAYLSHFGPKDMAKVANLAGHIVCRFPGVVPIDIDMLKSEMSYL